LLMVALAIRLMLGFALLGGGDQAFVLSSDDGDAYDAVARWQAFGTPIPMTPRLEGKWPLVVRPGERWAQGYWLFLAAQYRAFGSAYASTLLLQAFIGAGGVLAGYVLARRVLGTTAARV